jgi:hypothetical protein
MPDEVTLEEQFFDLLGQCAIGDTEHRCSQRDCKQFRSLHQSLPFYRHFPDTEVVGRDLPSLGVPRQRNSIAANSLKAKTARCPPRWAETRCFVFTQGVPFG